MCIYEGVGKWFIKESCPRCGFFAIRMICRRHQLKINAWIIKGVTHECSQCEQKYPYRDNWTVFNNKELPEE